MIRIELQELVPDERLALVRERFAGVEVPDEIARAVVERAGGNPFFIVELLEALLDRNAVRVQTDQGCKRLVRQGTAPFALPTSLEGLIASRLDELPGLERRVVRWLAVMGPGHDADVVAELVGDDVRSALAFLEERGLVARHGRTHGLSSAVIRRVAYDTTDEADRVRMHHRFAQWLDQRGTVVPARVARHLERAGARQEAARVYLEAAEEGESGYGNRETLKFLERALALLDPNGREVFALHEKKARIVLAMGRHDEWAKEVRVLKGLAEQSGSPAELAVAYRCLATQERLAGRIDAAKGQADRAFSAALAADRRDLEVDTLMLRAGITADRGDVTAALALTDRALEVAASDPSLLPLRGSVLVQRSVLERRLRRREGALAAASEAFVISRRRGLRREEAAALHELAEGLAALGAGDDAAMCLRASLALDRRLGDRRRLGIKLSLVGQLAAEVGDFPRALDFLDRAGRAFVPVRIRRNKARRCRCRPTFSSRLDVPRKPRRRSTERWSASRREPTPPHVGVSAWCERASPGRAATSKKPGRCRPRRSTSRTPRAIGAWVSRPVHSLRKRKPEPSLRRREPTSTRPRLASWIRPRGAKSASSLRWLERTPGWGMKPVVTTRSAGPMSASPHDSGGCEERRVANDTPRAR